MNSGSTGPSPEVLLRVRGLRTHFDTDDGPLCAVDSIDLTVHKGEIFGVVGESGSGKTVMALSLLRLIRPPGTIVGGEVDLEGQPIGKLTERELADVLGARIGIVFQDPARRLNPVFAVGTQLAEIFQVHYRWDHRRAWIHALQLMERVGIPDAAVRAHAYPHELSIGQAQRVMIAIALALEPALLIADEPTSALDATIQAQILELMGSLQREREMAILLITHDMGVIAQMCRRAAVMYAGHFVEQGDIQQIFHSPRHPYTRALLESLPLQTAPGEPLPSIPGSVPDPVHLPSACRFAERCKARAEHGLEICERVQPSLIQFWPDQSVRCWLYQEAPGHSPPLRP